jgi:hypothetical protein
MISEHGSSTDPPALVSVDAIRRGSELKQIEHALQGLKFGTVTVVVQDGCVVQIERTEKHRLRRRDPA